MDNQLEQADIIQTEVKLQFISTYTRLKDCRKVKLKRKSITERSHKRKESTK